MMMIEVVVVEFNKEEKDLVFSMGGGISGLGGMGGMYGWVICLRFVVGSGCC